MSTFATLLYQPSTNIVKSAMYILIMPSDQPSHHYCLSVHHCTHFPPALRLPSSLLICMIIHPLHTSPPFARPNLSTKSVFDCLTIGIIHETMVVHMTWVWTFFNNHIYIYICYAFDPPGRHLLSYCSPLCTFPTCPKVIQFTTPPLILPVAIYCLFVHHCAHFPPAQR